MTNAQEFFRAALFPYSISNRAACPLFKFFVFSTLDLEIAPDLPATFTGPVHGNSNIFMTPQSSATFADRVTATGTIFETNSPLDPTVRAPGVVNFAGGKRSGTVPLTLAFDTNHTASAWRMIVELPPAGEGTNSSLSKDRFYNKADLIVDLTGASTTPAVKVKTGLFDNFATVITPAQWIKFIDYDNTFYNAREGKTVRVLDIDVQRLKNWSITNAIIRPKLGNRDISSIYVNDMRTFSMTDQPGVRVVNGAELPSRGLTIATRDPIYVWGHFNNKISSISNVIGGTSTGTNTTYTRPAALIGDSITILSRAWNNPSSSNSLANRIALSTTVNAALVGGIVETTATNFSGGVENFIRLLEDWSGQTLTFNGSIVIAYPSLIARTPWQVGGDVYASPIRQWNYDANLRSASKLPPGTPAVGVLDNN